MKRNLKDLIDKKPCRVPVEGIGRSHGTYKGSGGWKWQDDKGKTFTFNIPNMIHVKDLLFCILSPQCCSRTLDEPAKCVTHNYDIVMKWNNGRNVRDFPIAQPAMEPPTAQPTTEPATILHPGPQVIDFHDDEIEPHERHPEKPLKNNAQELLQWHI